MRFVLAFMLIFSSVFDACFASSLPEAVNIEAQSDIESCGSHQFTESSDQHESHDHKGHDLCQQCHSCHHVVILKAQQNISTIDTSALETPYQFFIPSAFIKLLKRPPKV